MQIDLDVHEMAKMFGVDEKLIQAVVNAEGGGDHIIKAVQCSIPSVHSRGEALMILCRSAVHAMCDYLAAADERDDFVQFWGKRWAPSGATNDPTNLNANWPTNVSSLWRAA